MKTIITAVRQPGGARVSDLAEATGASLMTIRRDLAELERQGFLRRVHGGAISLPARGTRLPFAVRMEGNVTEKRLIAAQAAAVIPDGSSVIVDSGTSCVMAATALTGRDITALALSVRVALALGERPGVRVVTPGGVLDGGEQSWTGHRAIEDIRSFRADVALLGICAWDEESGVTAASHQDAEVKQEIRASARQLIAVSTADKLGTSATFAVYPSEAVDSLISHGIDPAISSWLTAAGVEVIDMS